ncbi:MAG: electron transfer flavoprotein-ubiquinone oxidoreductase [Desulfobacterales bacterium]|nr:electron transfer flavoprotein-ubiquinone oxidoreductase [Desulfobacterales bacterium]
MSAERESIDFDVVFVGGGPASLAGAIRLMQLAREKNMSIEVALIEKGSDIGAHSVSGAILNPRALHELMPDHIERGCPVEAVVQGDAFYYLTRNHAFRAFLEPRYLHNKGFYIISLSKFCRWLGGIAEDMGINIFPGFAGNEVLYDETGQTVTGIRTGDKGLGKDGEHKANFEPGIDLKAKVTVFGEGARGSLYKQIEKKMNIAADRMPQVYETGVKEVIQLPDNHYFKTGKSNDIHFLGYPLGMNTPGGGFIYEMQDNKIAIGYLTGLGYEDALIDPYDMFIRFKRHPFVSAIIRGGKVIEQGARTVSTGGYFSIPKLSTNGAVFVGGSAAMHNSPALKGIHVSMKSGMLAAEAIIAAIARNSFTEESLGAFQTLFDVGWLKKELYEGRNFAQALAKKGVVKLIHLGAQYVTKGRGLIERMPLEEDCTILEAVKAGPTTGNEGPDKSAYDDSLYVDKLTGVYLSKTKHREDQPSHLIVHDTHLCVTRCFDTYRSPCTRFCPGNVYEIETDAGTGERRLKLNPSNCFHCKTCDIKDPYRNITWTCPEGGEGPGYTVV